MGTLKETTALSLDKDIIKDIKELAQYEDRSFSAYVNRVLKAHISFPATQERLNKIKENG